MLKGVEKKNSGVKDKDLLERIKEIKVEHPFW